MLTFFAKKIVRIIESIENLLPRVHIYHIEDVFVFLVVCGIAFFSGNDYIEWIGAIGAFMSYKYAVFAFRLEEVLAKEEKEGKTEFHDAHKQSKLFFAKESIWLVYFVLLGAWSGIMSVFIFLSYPIWHKVRIKYHTNTKHIIRYRKKHVKKPTA